MPGKAASRTPSRPIGTDQRNESEAQRRGMYGSLSSPSSDTRWLGKWELKRTNDDEASYDRNKRRRGEGDKRALENDRRPPRSLSSSSARIEKVETLGRGTTLGNVVDPQHSARAPRKSTTHSSPSRDPRLRRSEEPTPLASPSQSVQTPPIPNPMEAQMQKESAPQAFLPQDMPLTVDTTHSHTSAQQGNYQPHTPPDQQKAHLSLAPPSSTNEKDGLPQPATSSSGPNDSTNPHPPPTPTVSPIEATANARLQVLADEERIKQARHDDEMARLRTQQDAEYEAELEEVIMQRRDEAERARRAAVQRLKEEHERRMEELRRR